MVYITLFPKGISRRRFSTTNAWVNWVWFDYTAPWCVPLERSPGWSARPKLDMSRPSQTESVYVQTLPDGKCLSRLSCGQNFSCVHRAFKSPHVQTIVRSKLHMSRQSCVQNCICPDYRAFKIAYVQTIVRSKLHMSRQSCVQNCICPDNRAFKIAYVQTIVRSKLHMSRLSCVQNCICPDYRAFIFLSRPCNFEHTTPPCAFISVWTYRFSVWHLNLGGQ